MIFHTTPHLVYSYFKIKGIYCSKKESLRYMDGREWGDLFKIRQI